MIFSGIITFGGSAVQFTSVLVDTTGAAIPANYQVWRIEAEPLRGNTHVSYVGLSTVTNNGTGASIQELAVPGASAIMDRFILGAPGFDRAVDPSDYYGHGFSGEKMKVTVWTV